MTDSEAPDHEVEARLIRAGMRESPPSGTLQRTLAGLGLGASAMAAASSAGALGAAKAAAPVTVLGLAKWASLGAASGLMLSAATYAVHDAVGPATPRTPSSAAPSTVSELPAPGAISTIASEPVRTESPAAPARPSAAPSPPSRSTSSPDTELPLATELAFVDRAREAFQRSDPGAALALLESYERSFPEVRLMPEVLYLRMQAHRQLGATERAAKLAERLFRDFPKSPHASSARSILQGSSAR